MINLGNYDTFIVQQKKEWTEILTSLETKNKYKIFDASGAEIFFAFEDKSNWLIRQLLKAARPFTMTITDTASSAVLHVQRPFRWFFPEVTITDAQGREIGKIVKQFTFFRRLYTVTDKAGAEVFRLFGPILKPWTFNIIENEREVGKVTKKWSGAIKEMFTAADNFGAEFPREWSDEKKSIILGAIFLIDIVHFENKN